MIDFREMNILEKLLRLDPETADYFRPGCFRAVKYQNILHEQAARRLMTMDELKERVKNFFMKLDREWFFDDNQKRFDKIRLNFLQTNINYSEGSKLRKHLTDASKIEEAARAIREILAF